MEAAGNVEMEPCQTAGEGKKKELKQTKQVARSWEHTP